MSQPVYGNINKDETLGINRQRKRNQTECDPVKIRSCRAVIVCLVLLCFLLLTAVTVLSVYIYTNNINYIQETSVTNLTEERDELLIKNVNLLRERDQLIKQLQIFVQEGWTYKQCSFYYLSTGTKNWTESRRDCSKRGADLIIINNKMEQDFVMNITRGKEFWIGITDDEEEGIWKWVDGTRVTPGFWASFGSITEPNGHRRENCAVTHLKRHPKLLGWIDVACNGAHQWICEKNILPVPI